MAKIRLANGNAYDIEGGASEHYCEMVFENLADAASVIEDFTDENMKTIEFLTEADEVCGVYTEKHLDHSSVSVIDGQCYVGFHISDIVPEAEELLNILLGGM